MATFSLTVTSGKVAATLTNYPAYVDLSEMPAGFWSVVANGGVPLWYTGGMSNKKEMVGKTFGLLTVVEQGVTVNKRILWKCVCECGQECEKSGVLLRTGHTKSCGCLTSKTCAERNKTHGMSKLPEYRVWKEMHRRCKNANRDDYKHYGGRGISVCKRWSKFENFYEDMGKRPSVSHSIDRIHTDKSYCPSNCVWATQTQQVRNRRRFHDNKSGYKGVSQKKNRYVARICANYKDIFVGSYRTLNEAIKARKEAELKYW